MTKRELGILSTHVTAWLVMQSATANSRLTQLPSPEAASINYGAYLDCLKKGFLVLCRRQIRTSLQHLKQELFHFFTFLTAN